MEIIRRGLRVFKRSRGEWAAGEWFKRYSGFAFVEVKMLIPAAVPEGVPTLAYSPNRYWTIQ
jgi:hypothetical protein